MQILDALDKVARGDPEAERSFDRVRERVQRFLWRYLARYLPRPEDREDVTAKFVSRLWARRSSLSFTNEGTWWVFVAKSGRNIAYDLLASAEPPHDDIDEISERDVATIDFVASQTGLRARIYEAADELWLGVDPATPFPLRKAQLLAAQLRLLHGQPVEEICAILGTSTRADRVKAWIEDERVHRQLCYASLYWDNDTLASHLLHPGREVTSDELDELSRSSVGKNGPSPWASWEWDDVRIILWRFRNGLRLDKILQLDPSLTRERVDETFGRCAGLLPFRNRALQLQASLSRAHSLPLSNADLYKRLVFQYHVADDLPHRQIIIRVEASAEVGNYKLTEGMLNVWLSNGRILKSLVAYLQEDLRDDGF